MTSNRPYLIRAIYDWLVDNDLTPYLLVDAGREGVYVPENYVEGGRIVLNVSPSAVRDLELGNELIAFHARFGGSGFSVSLPPGAVLGVYARENGEGIQFAEQTEDESAPTDADSDTAEPKPPRTPGGKPSLKVIK